MCDYSLYKSTVDSDIDIGTESIMFSGCPSVCACVRVARCRSFSDLLAVDFSLCVLIQISFSSRLLNFGRRLRPSSLQ